MRKLTFDFGDKAAVKTIAANSVDENDYVDLSERLKKTVNVSSEQGAVTPTPETDSKAQPETTTKAEEPETVAAEEIPNEESATFEEEGFTSFKEGAGKKLEEFVENPEEFAVMLIKLGNVGRMVFLPGLYDRFMFSAEERNDLPGILAKRNLNEKNNAKPDLGFNNYEQRLFRKHEKLQAAVENISYTESEIKWLAKIVAKRIKDVTVAVWLEKYDWLIALLYLEFNHSQAVWASKAEDFIAKKFNTKAA